MSHRNVLATLILVDIIGLSPAGPAAAASLLPAFIEAQAQFEAGNADSAVAAVAKREAKQLHAGLHIHTVS